MFKTIHNKALDDLNLSILKELHKNARVTTTEVGKRVGLSGPAVADRIQKLEDLGFIRGYHAVVNLDKIGLSIQAFITFKAHGMKHAELVTLVDAIPEVTEWHAVTGSASILMKVATCSREALGAVIEHLEQHGETNTSLILSGSTNREIIR